MAAPKIDQSTADKIRAEAKRWPWRVLAKRYGVGIATVSDIVNGRTWAGAT